MNVLVELDGAKFDPLVVDGNGDAQQLAPDPPMSVADCVGLGQSQQFDVTASVEEFGPMREVNEACVVRDVILFDGSQMDDKLQQLKISYSL